MNAEQSVVERLRLLTPDRQQEVIDFIEFLLHRSGPDVPPRSPRGLCADLGVSISAEDIDEARREMWSSFAEERPT